MLEPRLIPCLLLQGQALVKTCRFAKPRYVGDPLNTARIFNELEVDELIVLDIGATRQGSGPPYELLRLLCEECFMPLAYGGGITSCQQIQKLLQLGCEKVALNSGLFDHPQLLQQASRHFGSQALVACLDVKRSWLGKLQVFSHGATRRQPGSLLDWAQRLEESGAGEILLTCIDREGTWKGPDLEVIKMVASKVTIPVIAHGGVSSLEQIGHCVTRSGASAVAVGSMVVFQAQHMGVLIQFPERKSLRSVWQHET